VIEFQRSEDHFLENTTFWRKKSGSYEVFFLILEGAHILGLSTRPLRVAHTLAMPLKHNRVYTRQRIVFLTQALTRTCKLTTEEGIELQALAAESDALWLRYSQVQQMSKSYKFTNTWV